MQVLKKHAKYLVRSTVFIHISLVLMLKRSDIGWISLKVFDSKSSTSGDTVQCLIFFSGTLQESLGKCVMAGWSSRGNGISRWLWRLLKPATLRNRGEISWEKPASWHSSIIPTSSTWRESLPAVSTLQDCLWSALIIDTFCVQKYSIPFM